MQEPNYKQVFLTEMYGHKGKKFCLKILMDAGRELSNVDKSHIRACADDLQNKIWHQTLILDPEIIKEKSEQRRQIQGLFAGHLIFIEETKNEYDNFDVFPWFIAYTKLGRIKIGWRKRVINIDWQGSLIIGTANNIFPNEDTTKGDCYIHAWGYDKAQEYINKLLDFKPITP